MKPVREIVSREIIDDLWGAGYTILPRARHPDPFFVPPEIVPRGTSYQWMPLKTDDLDHKYDGWIPVLSVRHDGYFMPAGFVGEIEVMGMGLFEKPKEQVDKLKAAGVIAAHKKTDDWMKQFGGDLSGHVKIGDNTASVGKGDGENSQTLIPRHLTPYIASILAERDRILKEDDFASKELATKAAIDVIQLQVTESTKQMVTDWAEKNSDLLTDDKEATSGQAS
jgi:hypothetical protein